MSHDADHLKAHLTCPHCDLAQDVLLEMNVRAIERGAELAVGDHLEVDQSYLPNGGYFVLRTPGHGEPQHVVETWTCAGCKRGWLWARVTFEASRISAATAIALDRADVGTVHAINDFVADFVEVRTSVDLQPMSDAERLAYLEAHPPATLT